MSALVPFIGREQEMRKISECIETWGTRQVICIDGEGGIGKTRLLQEIRDKYRNLQQPEKPPVRIVILYDSLTSEWSQEFRDGAKSMATALGVDLQQFGADSVKNMTMILGNIIQQKPTAIVIRGGNSDAQLKAAIRQAIQQGIKVLTIDNRLDIQGIVTQVIHNEPEGIERAARQLIKDISYSGEIAIIRGKGNLQNEREAILHKVVEGYNISVVETMTIENNSVERIQKEAYYSTKIILQRYPKVKAIWTTWNEFAKGAIQALKDENRIDMMNILVYSFDLPQKDVTCMTAPDSSWKVTVVTDPNESGRIMVRLATLAAYGHPLESYYTLSPRLLTQEDVRIHSNDEAYLTGASDNIGWMPEELRSLLSTAKPYLHVLDIIDFDDLSFHNPEKMSRKIANMLHQETFKPFLRYQVEYRKMQTAGVSHEELIKQEEAIIQSFTKCFNSISKRKRIILFFDSTDDLKEGEGIWKTWEVQIPQFENTAVLIVGRNAGNIGRSLQKYHRDSVNIIHLTLLSAQDSKEYLQKRQTQRYITIEPELIDKLVFLAGGRPILLDLAVEWRAHGISLDWLVEDSMEKLRLLNEKQKQKRQQQFEKSLVSRINKLRDPSDQLILLMSYIYPLNIEMISELLTLRKEDAQKLFEEAISYVFVKQLPSMYIKLHEEVERMVKKYVWPEVDPESRRRRWYSTIVLQYLTREIKNFFKEIEEYKVELRRIEKEEKHAEALEISLKIQELEQDSWLFKEQQIDHTLFTKLDDGVEIFVDLFDEATRTSRFPFRQRLFEKLQTYANEFSPKQRYIRDIHQVKLFIDNGKYGEAKKLCEEIDREDISSEQKIEILILLGNVEIRLGYVKESIFNFEEAMKISEANQLAIWRIKALNALGWALRLLGDYDNASKYYIKARQLIDQASELDKKKLRDDCGWISNNLAFVLSDNNKTRRTAINIARSTIEYWQSIGNDIGIGAGYLVLGIAYYRSEIYDDALEAFEKALKIFLPLKYNDWLGQIYSWRGALYQDMKRLEDAERDLLKSLEIGSPNIKAMTLNRLGRVYMSQGKWDLAEKTMRESFEIAQKIPDYVYWLGSIARLAFVATEKEEYRRLDEFEQMVKDFRNKIDNPEKNSLGMTYLALAKLALGQNDMHKIDTIVDFLQQGISLVTEFGSYAHTDILSRLRDLEKAFHKIKPEIICSIGQALQKYIRKKEIEDVNYSVVVPVIDKWATWKKEEKVDG